MGQYHLLVNLTKKEFVHPHRIGIGSKLGEQFSSFYGSMGDVIGVLIAAPQPRGGGDFNRIGALGRWHGDRIAMVGDYAENTDLPAEDRASDIFGDCIDARGGWVEISDLVIPNIEAEFEVRVKKGSDGWAERELIGWVKKEQSDSIAKSRMVPDLIIQTEKT